MTPEQQKDAERLDRYIAREGLSSVMNDTKWREAMGVISIVVGSMAGNLCIRAKWVNEAQDRRVHWMVGFPYNVPQPYKGIEWLEIEAFVGRDWATRKGQDFTDALTEAFSNKNIPFVRNGTVLRLEGYRQT